MSNTVVVVFQVADGATVALVPSHSKHIHHDNHDYVAGESELHLHFSSTLSGKCLVVPVSVE